MVNIWRRYCTPKPIFLTAKVHKRVQNFGSGLFSSLKMQRRQFIGICGGKIFQVLDFMKSESFGMVHYRHCKYNAVSGSCSRTPYLGIRRNQTHY